MSEEKCNQWKPQINEDYWAFYGSGLVENIAWVLSSEDKFNFDMGNVYRTKEDAETAFSEMNNDIKRRWKPEYGEQYWTIAYNFIDAFASKWFGDIYDIGKLCSGLVFRTPEEAEAAIAKMDGQKGQAAEPDDKDRWKPKAGEGYWTVLSEKCVTKWRWNASKGDRHDREQFSAGLVFRTEEEAEAALAEMKAQAQEQPAKPDEERWKPEYGETCWTVSFGEVTKWTWRGEEADNERWARGILFRTSEEADAVLEKSWEEARTEYAHDIPPTAASVLTAAAQHMQDRASTYDKPEGERSMAATVAAFNAITGASLTEAQGWLFMAVLKQVRLFQRPGYHADSAEDAAAYVALMAEAKAKEAGE